MNVFLTLGLKDLKQYLNSKSRESRTVKRMAVSSDDDGGAQGYGDAYYIGKHTISYYHKKVFFCSYVLSIIFFIS